MRVFKTLILFTIILISASFGWLTEYQVNVVVIPKCLCRNEDVELILGPDILGRYYDTMTAECGVRHTLTATLPWDYVYPMVAVFNHTECRTKKRNVMKVYYNCDGWYYQGGVYWYYCNEK